MQVGSTSAPTQQNTRPCVAIAHPGPQYASRKMEASMPRLRRPMFCLVNQCEEVRYLGGPLRAHYEEWVEAPKEFAPLMAQSL